MWITADTETLGLDARKFVLGCICDEKMRTKSFFTREEMMVHILELGERCKKRNERLTVYAHNMQYDYIAMGAHNDKQNVIYATRPFIADRMYEGRSGSYIKWIDTTGIWRGTLASIGEAIGEKKGETPQWLIDADEEAAKDLTNKWLAAEYCAQDCKVLMKFLLLMKQRLADIGMRPWMMLTAAQLSMQYMLKELAHHKGSANWIKSYYSRELWECKNKEHVRKAYRGGRVEIFTSGTVEHVDHYDLNSLYPYAATQIPVPDLRTETNIKYPLKKGMTQEGLLDRIGVTTVLIKTPPDEKLGILAIRQEQEDEGESGEYSTYPETKNGERSLIYGTWTNLELKEAIKRGYEIVDAIETTYWQEAKETDGTPMNPLAETIRKLYEQRQSAKTPFDNAFFKLLMNGMIGKFAQRRDVLLTKMVDIEEVPLLRSEGWETTGEGVMGTSVLMEKREGVVYPKHYCPIIAAYITAYARVELYKYLEGFPRDALVYTDTDSVIYKSEYRDCSATMLIKQKSGKGLGEWKELSLGGEYHGYAKKAYRVNDDIRISRVPHRDATRKAFDEGNVEYTEIYGIKNAPEHGLIGAPVQRIRTLKTAEKREEGHFFIDTKEKPDDETIKRILASA